MAHKSCAGFLAAHPGLAEALDANHYISRDMKERFEKWGSLSEKQVALAFKLAVPRAPESHVPAPVGRVEVTGRVVSVKEHFGNFGTSLKMTVKVDTNGGSWLAWGSVPSNLVNEVERGTVVKFTATLKRGNDVHFALFSRPTKASVVVAPPVNGVRSVEEREEHAAAVREDDDGSKADAAREAGVSFLDWVA